jgi:ABC-type branched-subunit amino acid transport system substrate-binding protein
MLFFCLLAFGVAGKAQEIDPDDPREQLFQEGLRHYTTEEYLSAATLFERLVRDYPSSYRVTAAAIMRGKALYELGENLEAARAFRAFLVAYPHSRYAADAHYSLGKVYERISRFEEASQELFAAWGQMPEDPPHSLFGHIVAALDSIIDHQMSVGEVERFLVGATPASLRAYLWLKLGEKENERENSNGVFTAIDTLTQRYPGNPFSARALLLKARVAGSSNVKLAVLLPLMSRGVPSAAKEIAADVYEGIVYAHELYEQDRTTRTKVTLETRDTERDPSLAAKLVRELAADRSVIGIIGPVFSSTAMTAAVAAQSSGIPLVSPTANANGVAAAGPYIFQANPDYETRGRAMARYAVLVRGFRSLATLAPSDTYGRQLAEAFVAEARQLGAKVVSQEWYQKGASDLKEQFSNIRKAGMVEQAEPRISFSGKLGPSAVMRMIERGIPKRRIDSLMSKGSIINAEEIFGANARAVLDSFGIRPYVDLSQLDSLEYPITSINAIYAPISNAGEIGVVSSQLVYFHFVTQLLGSGEWNDLSELHEHKRYTNGMIFETDSYADTNSPGYRSFCQGFVARFKKTPSRNALYGFDTAQLVLALIRNGVSTRTALARVLSLMKDYQGLHSKIGFSSSRVNLWLPILQFTDDEVRRLDEIRVE